MELPHDNDVSDRGPFQVSRRVLLAGAAASVVLVACGSSDDSADGAASTDPSSPSDTTTDASDGPESGLAFGTYVLAQRFPQDVQEPGLQRLPISLATADGQLVSDGPEKLGAEVLDVDGAPLDITVSAVRRDLESGPYYSFRVPIETPGV